MCSFTFKVREFLDNGLIKTYEIKIKAKDKLESFAKMSRIYSDSTKYDYELIDSYATDK